MPGLSPSELMPIWLAAVGQTEKAEGGGILSLLLDADLVVQLVLLVLVGMAIGSTVISLNRYAVVRKAESQSLAFVDAFWKSRHLDQIYDQIARYEGSPVAAVFKAGYQELSRLTSQEREVNQQGRIALDGDENIERALRKARSIERTSLEHLTTFLATTGSTAPFIGLFGTVWGILRAFQKIDVTGQATIQTVGGDIAHALIATAVGLVAAIPAVMAFNYFNRRIRVICTEMDNFSDDFLNIVRRHARSTAGR
jgi:biopolymer transport protein TolQ